MLKDLNNGHYLAILEQSELCETLFQKLALGNNEHYEQLVKQNAEIFSRLRTKVIPEKVLELYAETLYKSLSENGKSINFACVLASSTALDEINNFLNFLNCYNNFAIKPRVCFVIINWSQFKNDGNKITESSINFLNTLIEVEKLIKNINSNYQINAVDIIFDDDLNIISPDIFADEFNNIYNNTEDEIIRRDSLWITGFYERANSLKNLHEKQAYIDLAIRRCIYKYAEKNFFNDDSMNILVTSELNKRFLKCYRADCAIFNISV